MILIEIARIPNKKSKKRKIGEVVLPSRLSCDPGLESAVVFRHFFGFTVIRTSGP